jgi:hypothetical protein
MPRSLSSRLILSLLLYALALPVVAMAQSQDGTSVADAARRAREQKKNAVKPTKVVTEDDIPARIPTADESAAPAPAASGAATSSAAAPADQANAPASKDGAKTPDDAETVTLKEVVAQAQRDADVAKRDLSLDQDTFYSNPDYVHDTAGKAKLDNLRQLFTEKLQILDQAKAQLAARKPAGPEAPATKPVTPQP